MKKLLLILTAGLGCLAGPNSRGEGAFTLNVPYASKYVFRGLEVTGDSMQPSVEYTREAFTGGVWSNLPMNGTVSQEYDFYGGYDIPLNKDWLIDAGGTLYYYPQLASGPGAHNTTIEPYVGLSGNVGGLAPGLYAYYDLTLENFVLEGRLSGSLPLPAIGTSLDGSVSAGRLEPKVGDGYTYYRLGVGLPFKVSAHVTFNAGLSYTHNDLPGVDHDAFYVTAGLTMGI